MTREQRPLPVSRLVPWTALVGALALLLAGAMLALYQEHLYQTERARETFEQAEILAASESAALAFDDRKAAGEYVHSVQLNPEIDAAGVYARTGALVVGFVRTGSPPLPARMGTEIPAKLPRAGVVAVVPVVEQSARLGTVYMRAAAEPSENRALREAVLGLLVLMAIVVIAGLANAQIKLQRQAQHMEEANRRLQAEMSERAKAEEALRQSQKMEAVGQLSGAIAHDFNNLLMIIKGNLHLLQRKLSIPGEDRHLRSAMEGVKRASSLTQRILAFSRKQDLSPVAVQLSELVTGMDDLIRNALREDIEFVRELRSDQWTVIDRNQMENVILNLAINARDAMPNGGRLTISTDRIDIYGGADPDIPNGGYIRFVMRDTGIGMSEDVRAKALDPFFTTKPSGHGTGLGLSTTFGFISQSGGYMRIESDVGKGTAIIIYLPVARVAASRAAEVA